MARPPKRPPEIVYSKVFEQLGEVLANKIIDLAEDKWEEWQKSGYDLRWFNRRGRRSKDRPPDVIPNPPESKDPYEVLGVQRGLSLDEYEAFYKIRARKLHPDTGGSDAQMAELNTAIEDIRKELSG